MTEQQEQAISVANRHIIERPRLTRMLDETTARVIMLVAPAGYGKTVLARQWLSQRPHAFYRASESADLGVIGSGLLDAAMKITRDGGDRFEQWLRARRKTEPSDLAADLLAEDLRMWPSGAWLAVDDYHLLPSEAERLIGTLRRIPTLRLLLTSRRRPEWCSARDLLYGDIYELSTGDLAMSRQEASGVLTGLRESASEIIELADGWPAVIGLAAFAPDRHVRRHAGLPPALHSYIAEELYASLGSRTKSGLSQLSLLSNPTDALAGRLLGCEARAILDEGLRVGFLTDYQPAVFAIHPLLREFLHEKLLLDLDQDSRLRLLHETVDLLEEEHMWEDAFDVIRRFGLDNRLESLVATAMYDLLDRGMLATLGQFLDHGTSRLNVSPVLELAAAELTFREGFHERCLALAHSAAERLKADPDLTSRAYCRAGHAAYFLDEINAAASNFARARAAARTDGDKRKAIWGQFLAALDHESDDAVNLLSEFEGASGSEADDLLRIQNGRLHLGMRLGSVASGLRGAEAVAETVAEARDPVIRASFWHVYSGALRLAARYDEALAASERTEHEIDRFDLGFARAYVQLTRSLMHMGLSQYDEAETALDEAAAMGSRTGDVFIQLSERVNRCRLFLLRGSDVDAIACTAGTWPKNATAGLLGEFLACRALTLARSGCTEQSDELLTLVKRTTRENEARALGECARALIALDLVGRNPSTLVEHFQTAVSRWVLDPYVFAFKLDQRLPRAIQQTPTLRSALDDLRPFIGPLVQRSDEKRHDTPALDSLSPREYEVLGLVAEGLTNAEIASTLFLAVPTVKVHVRSVLRKLGLRTRTEAAVYAVTRRRPEAAEEMEPPEGPNNQA
jgi:DNA-binding CsgD family transcriptional regulator